ncbi:hypothetical protein LguiA_010048 [Lonicera macranthoides]
MTKTPASPQDELPILSTHDDPSPDFVQSRPLFISPLTCIVLEEEEEVVLMATISPPRTIGNTNPELHPLLLS